MRGSAAKPRRTTRDQRDAAPRNAESSEAIRAGSGPPLQQSQPIESRRSSAMAIEKHHTPMLDQLETGPWPSFISGIKRLRDQHPEQRINEVCNDLLGQLEHSYETRKGYWKGGTVSVYGYGGGIIPRFSEVGKAFPKSREYHTLRVQPPAGNHYTN